MRTIIFFIAFLISSVSITYGQNEYSEKEILQNIIIDSKTCNKTYLVSSIYTSLIEEFKSFLKENNYYNENRKTYKLPLTKKDKKKIINELDLCKDYKWTDSTQFENTQIIPHTNIFKFDCHIDDSCLSKLTSENKNIKILALCKPIYSTNKNSFIICTVEIGIHKKYKSFYFANSKMFLYKKTKSNKWKKSSVLYSSITCNG